MYNIAEAAVFELNNEKIKKEAEQSFKDKYGELPEDIITIDVDESINDDSVEENIDNNVNINSNNNNNVTEITKTNKITNIF